MKKIIKKNSSRVFESYVKELFEPLDYSNITSRQKILKICHAGKFLFLLDEDYIINEVFEKPDFIIRDDKGFVGLEHQIIIDEKSKQREGFFQNIFQIAEFELQKETNLPNFLANCYVFPNVIFKLKEKKKLVYIIIDTVKEYILTGILPENPIIESIVSMDHSQITLSENLGGWI